MPRNISQIQFFPFSKDIPWKIKNNAIVPQIDAELIQELLENKDIYILGHGRPVEAFLSLCVAQGVKRLNPRLKVSWSGPEAFRKYAPPFVDLDPSLQARFPAPIFFDKGNGAYYNPLYNAGENRIFLGKTYKNKNCISKIVLGNLLAEWKAEYMPEFRGDIDKRLGKYVLMIGAEWGYGENAKFAGYLNGAGMQLVIMDDGAEHYFGKNVIKIGWNFDKMIGLIMGASYVMGNDDYSIMAGALGRRVIGGKGGGIYSVEGNVKYFGGDGLFFRKMGADEVWECIFI